MRHVGELAPAHEDRLPVAIPATGIPIRAVTDEEIADIEMEDERESGLADLLDVDVWLSLSIPDHVHHVRARRYWDSEAADQRVLNRVIALAILRLLTDSRTFGAAALDAAAARRVLRSWLGTRGVAFAADPPQLDDALDHWADALDIRGRDWTDAYLAAFATAGGYRLVSFDAGFARYPGLAWLHLESASAPESQAPSQP
jgi:uncharacterized protein